MNNLILLNVVYFGCLFIKIVFDTIDIILDIKTNKILKKIKERNKEQKIIISYNFSIILWVIFLISSIIIIFNNQKLLNIDQILILTILGIILLILNFLKKFTYKYLEE